MTPDTAKKKALELAVSHIQKQFGDGSIMTLGKHSQSREISVIATGAIAATWFDVNKSTCSDCRPKEIAAVLNAAI